MNKKKVEIRREKIVEKVNGISWLEGRATATS